jgi:hypothetical protein
MEPGWSEGNSYHTVVAPAIAVPDPAEEAVGLHTIFMKRRGLFDAYQVYYSYFGTDLYITPTPEPTDPGEDPTATPTATPTDSPEDPTPTATPFDPNQYPERAYLPLVMRGAP